MKKFEMMARYMNEMEYVGGRCYKSLKRQQASGKWGVVAKLQLEIGRPTPPFFMGISRSWGELAVPIRGSSLSDSNGGAWCAELELKGHIMKYR